MGSSKKGGINAPAMPGLLLDTIPNVTTPNFKITGDNYGIVNDPVNGSSVGVYGMGNLRNLSDQTQAQLASLLPSVGQLTSSDMNFGNAYANNLYNRGKSDLDSALNSNINRFREDAFRRGLAASSSMLNGMGQLYNSNAQALENLRSDADQQGLGYSYNLANMRNSGANFLKGLNSDLYHQTNTVPLQLGQNYAINQARLNQANNALNLQRLSNYYTITNQGLNNYNNAYLAKKNNGSGWSSFLGSMAGGLLSKL